MPRFPTWSWERFLTSPESGPPIHRTIIRSLRSISTASITLRVSGHPGADEFSTEPGDIVIYDRVFENREHDHIGIVIEKNENSILAAEGNVDNRSGIIERPIDEHIRAYIRIPDGYKYTGQA